MLTPRMLEFARFCIVGFIGYIVDAGVMEGLVRLGLSAPHARLFSIPTALQVTYLLHGIFTFQKRGGIHLRGWALFMIFNLAGAAINYLVFLAAFHVIALPKPMYVRQASLVCGMAVALWFNYWANRQFVFTRIAAENNV